MENPFNAGSGVPPPFLAGRENHLKIFRNTLRSIDDGHIENLIMSGLRGTGKTVLMEEFNKICIDEGFLPIKRLEFSRKYCDPAEFSKALKYDIRIAIETFSKIQRAKGKIKSAISYLKPKQLGIPAYFYYEPSYDVGTSIPFEDHLKEYLSSNWQIFENSGYKGVVFLFDEFQTISNVPSHDYYVLSDFIGALNEVQKKCKYFAVLSGLPNLRLNVKKAKSYAERMFKTVEVGNLSKEDAKKAIINPLNDSSHRFEKSLTERLVHETGQYPYFIQFYCKEIINNIDKLKIKLKDYERINPIIIKQLEINFFDNRLELLSPDEITVIFAMSKINKNDIPFGMISKKTSPSIKDPSKFLQRLEEKGLIYNFKRGIYRFSVPLLREYLLRKISD